MLFVSCSDSEIEKSKTDKINFDFSDMDLSGISFGLDKKDRVITLGTDSSNQIDGFVKDLTKELFDLVKQNSFLYYRLEFSLYPKNKKLIIHYISEKQLEQQTRDPYNDLFGSCPDGWTDLGICLSEACVRKKIKEALTDVDTLGDCQRVQVSIGYLGARVCSGPCD